MTVRRALQLLLSTSLLCCSRCTAVNFTSENWSNDLGQRYILKHFGRPEHIIAQTKNLLALHNSKSSSALRLFMLGDSVMRDMAALWSRHYGGAEFGNATDSKNKLQFLTRAQIKEQCGAASPGSSRSGRCSFFTKNLEIRFMWLQWLSVPSPVSQSTSFQAEDGCYGEPSLEHCFSRLFDEAGIKSDDVLFIRVGLEYVLYGGAFEPIIDWQNEFNRSLPQALQLLKRLFKGQIIFLLLQPISTNYDNCKPPIWNAMGNVTVANNLMATVLEKENVPFLDISGFSFLFSHQRVVPEYSQDWKPFDADRFGLYDCVHPAEPQTSLTMNLLLKLLVGRSGHGLAIRP